MSLYNWNQLNGTAWFERIPIGGEDEADLTDEGARMMIAGLWDHTQLRSAYTHETDFQRSFDAGSQYRTVREGLLPAAVLYNSSYWDQAIVSVRRVGDGQAHSPAGA